MGDAVTTHPGWADAEVKMEQVDDAADKNWKQVANAAIRATARRLSTLTADDVWETLEGWGVPAPREPRALGPRMTHAVKEGWIIRTDEYRPSIRRHASPLRVYVGGFGP